MFLLFTYFRKIYNVFLFFSPPFGFAFSISFFFKTIVKPSVFWIHKQQFHLEFSSIGFGMIKKKAHTSVSDSKENVFLIFQSENPKIFSM